jgi:hypothetical protein
MNFELEYSTFWLLGILVIALVSAWFSYRNKSGFDAVPKSIKTLLYSLRFSSIFFILVLLLGLLFKNSKERVEAPIFFVVTDNSSSMLNYKDSAEVKKTVQNTVAALKSNYGNQFKIKQLSIGSMVRDTNRYTFDEVNSNLEEAFNFIHTNYYNRNVGGIAFISDGNFNVGANPIYNAGKLRTTPVFTLAVGDSIQKKDQLIRNVFNNPLAFYLNDFPVEIDLSSYQYSDKETTLKIIRKNKVVASKTIQYSSGPEDFKKIRFLLPADEIGYHTYTIQLENKKDETTLKNNIKRFYVEVLDSRNKLLILSTAPHPDISALKNVLAADENIECETALFNEWNGKGENTNLVICHSPKNTSDLSVIEKLKDQDIPILYILGPKTNRKLYDDLGIKYSNRAVIKSDDIQAARNSNFAAFTINDALDEALTFYPPLQSRFGDFSIPPGASVLLNQRIGSVIKKSPLLFFLAQRGKRFGVIMGEGIWRWRINEYQREKNHIQFNELINKSIQFLTVPGKSKGLSIRFPKRITKEEPLVINGVFYNASLEAITAPILSLEIKDENNKNYNSQFSVYENGYRAQLGKLNPGRYEWQAKAVFAEKTYIKSGVIVVEDIDKERSESVANHSVLKQLAVQSKGSFYNLSDYQGLVSELKNRKEIASVSYNEDEQFKLIDYTWFLIFCAVLLSTEWFVKRLYGLT